jgi:hypothetical protein
MRARPPTRRCDIIATSFYAGWAPKASTLAPVHLGVESRQNGLPGLLGGSRRFSSLAADHRDQARVRSRSCPRARPYQGRRCEIVRLPRAEDKARTCPAGTYSSKAPHGQLVEVPTARKRMRAEGKRARCSMAPSPLRLGPASTGRGGDWPTIRAGSLYGAGKHPSYVRVLPKPGRGGKAEAELCLL